MGKKLRRVMGILLVVALLGSGLPVSEAQAATAKEYDIVYTIPQKGTFYTQSLAEAFKAGYENEGVHIFVLKDREIDFPPYIEYGCLNEHTILTVGYGATLTINKYNFQMNGRLIINGEVDIEHSQGIMYGSGTIDIVGDAKLLKRPYDFVKKGDICLEAKEISYGQTLADAAITTDKVNWIPSIEGSWSFLEQDYVPQAGTRCHDVVFTPKYPMSYERQVFEKSGQVTTKQAVPKLEQYEKPQVHVGENLWEIQPKMTFVDANTAEVIEGDFSFEQSGQVLYSTGEQEVLGSFIPKDKNYSTVTRYFKIDVLETEPSIVEMPEIRNQGTYGQTLGDIRYLQGKCRNPYTGKSVAGRWEWRNEGERLCLGDNAYTMLFLPEEEGYQRVEAEVHVTTLPKVMEDITWPTCSDIVYGQALSESSLSFTKNEYGTFAWKNENIRPEVKNKGVYVVFTPAGTDTYDWSRLAGYDEESKTVTFPIPIQVHSVKGELPAIQAAEISEGSCVSGSALSLQGLEGSLEWKKPEQVADKSAWYEVYYKPKDADNYDWSSYSPEEDGKIVMSVYLKVIPRPMAEIPTQTDKTTQNNSSIWVEKGEGDNSSTEVDKRQPVILDTANANTDSAYVITQLVSRVSTITGRTKIKKTSIRGLKRMRGKAKISWKKVSGANYLVQYSTSKKMKKAKKIATRKTSVTLTGLKRRECYFVRVRAWKKKNGKKIYGKWCKVKKIPA